MVRPSSCIPVWMCIDILHHIKQAQSNLTALNAIVWGTCNTDVSSDVCSSNMAGFASQLQSLCSAEISSENAQVVQALQGALLNLSKSLYLTPFLGLQAYDMMRSAGCLADQVTNSYCYVEASHSTDPSDLYFYQLPIGLSLPNNTTPSCSSCTKSLMGVYADALGKASKGSLSALSKTYSSAEEVAVKQCGDNYAQAAANTPSAAAPRLGINCLAMSLATISLGWLLGLLP